MSKAQKQFKPTGPFQINYNKLPGGKQLTKDLSKEFWSSNPKLEKIKTMKGVYIFGMSVTNTKMPCYVGKTKKTFESECFTDRNLLIYNGEILRYKQDYKPFMFFLAYEPIKGQKISDKVIREFETYVINQAYEKNKDLANTRSLDPDDRFFIMDLGGGRGRGAPTTDGKFYKKLMD